MRKGLLFIKGLKDPIDLEEHEAVEADRFIVNKAVPKDTPFSIVGIWTGTKGDMRFVKWETVEEKRTEPTFSKDELDSVSREVTAIQLVEGEPRKMIELRWMAGKGAIRLDPMENGGFVIRNPALYGLLSDRFSAYMRREARREYGMKNAVVQSAAIAGVDDNEF